MPLLGDQRPAHVDPAVGDPRIGQVFGDDARGDQLAESHDAVVPQLGILLAVDTLGSRLLELGKERFDALELRGTVPQIVDDRGMVSAQGGDFLQRSGAIAALQAGENTLQGVGRLAHGRDDDEQIAFVAYDLQQVAHTVGIAHRSSSEFVDLHRQFTF